jgi:NAD(P)-dependent dehydrogenase (short-subunit alcohol dehydrogenase family)
VITVNFYSHVFATRAAADEFRRGGGGQVLLVTHEADAVEGIAAYEASQAAVLSLVRSLSEELRPQRVGVNGLVVGPQVDDSLGTAAVDAINSPPAECTGRIINLAGPRSGDGR